MKEKQPTGERPAGRPAGHGERQREREAACPENSVIYPNQPVPQMASLPAVVSSTSLLLSCAILLSRASVEPSSLQAVGSRSGETFRLHE